MIIFVKIILINVFRIYDLFLKINVDYKECFSFLFSNIFIIILWFLRERGFYFVGEKNI